MESQSRADLITEMGCRLADCDHVAWPVPRLESYIADSLCLIAGLAPEQFSETKVLPLSPGSSQKFSSSVSALIAQSNASGDPIGPPLSKTLPLMSWSRPACLADDSSAPYRISSYSVNIRDGRIEVSPPVPIGAKAYVLASVAAVPESFEAVACQWIPVIKALVIGMCYSEEIDSESSRVLSTAFKKEGYELVGLLSRRDIQYRGGAVK